jgi:hypothetical protein
MKWLLQNTRAWSRDAEKFVMQNTAQVLEGIGFLGDIAKVVTDAAGRADIILNGTGRRRCFGGRR